MGEAVRQLREFDIWTMVTLGKHHAPWEYRKALISRGAVISDWADDCLAQMECSQERTELQLVNVSVKALGFQREATCGQIHTAAAVHGLYLCPAEVGPALLLQYPAEDFPNRVLIGMEALCHDKIWEPSVFCLNQDCTGLQLLGAPGHYNRLHRPDAHFIFALS